MSKTKLHILVAVLGVIFVLPSVGYFVVNGYWWLFDGNVLQTDKMGAAAVVALGGLMFWVLAHVTIEDIK